MVFSLPWVFSLPGMVFFLPCWCFSFPEGCFSFFGRFSFPAVVFFVPYGFCVGFLSSRIHWVSWHVLQHRYIHCACLCCFGLGRCIGCPSFGVVVVDDDGDETEDPPVTKPQWWMLRATYLKIENFFTHKCTHSQTHTKQDLDHDGGCCLWWWWLWILWMVLGAGGVGAVRGGDLKKKRLEGGWGEG